MMAKVQKAQDGWTKSMRWVARILALIATGLFVYFLVESGAQMISSLAWGPQGFPLLIGLVVALIGLLLAWRWELLGGVMAVIGGVATMALVCIGSGLDMLFCALLFTLPILAAGVLYLGCCWRTRVTEPSDA
jgi:peptidoglycan/LPS O-acetylase OafA/YrhL